MKDVMILVPMLDGFEEIELVSIVDILRRAGIKAIMASHSEIVAGTHNIYLKADCKISDIKLDDFSGIALAGGYNGMLNLCNDNFVIKALQKLNAENKLVAAICASPIVLGKAGVLKNRFACYPSCEDSILSNATYCKESVVIDENIITADGPASASKFALEIVRYLLGDEKRDEVAKGLLADF